MKYLGAPIYFLLYAICISIIWIMIFPIMVLIAFYTVWVEREYHKYRFIEFYKLFRFNSMINKWVLIVYGAIVSLLGIIYYLNHDNFGTISYTAYPEIIQRILGVNSVLVGVIISLLILTFRVLNENYGNFAFRAIFKSKFNRILISVFLFNFFLSIYSLMYWHQNEYNSYYAVLYWITLSSNIFLLCTAFPFAFLSLKSASQESNFDAILESLDEEWARICISNSMNHNSQISHLQINPIKEVTRIGRKLIKSEEYDSFRLLDEKYYHQLKSLSEIDYELRCFFYHEYREFINVLFTPSLKSEAHFFTSYLVYRRINLEREMLLLKIDKKQNPVWVHSHHYIQIDFSPFFYKTTVIKDETYFDAVITAYLRLGEFYIQKFLPLELPEFIKFGHEYMDVKMLISNYLGTGIPKIAERLLEENYIRHFQYMFKLFSLQTTALYSTNSRSTKIFLVSILETAKRDSFEFYLQANPHRISYLSFPFDGIALEYEIKLLGHKNILSGLLWAYDLSVKYNLLSNMLLNRLKAVVLGLYRLKVKEKVDITDALDNCLKEFDKMRSNYSKTTDLHGMDMYLAIHNYLIILKNEAIEKGVLDRTLTLKFNSLLKKFTRISDYDNTLKSSYYIRDESFT